MSFRRSIPTTSRLILIHETVCPLCSYETADLYDEVEGAQDDLYDHITREHPSALTTITPLGWAQLRKDVGQ